MTKTGNMQSFERLRLLLAGWDVIEAALTTPGPWMRSLTKSGETRDLL